MEVKKLKIELNAVTRRISDFDKETGNIYETVTILSKRANQIASDIKQELSKKIKDFETSNDNLDEIVENREQIEVARYYEQLPKPSILSVHEFETGQIYFRNPAKELQQESEL